MPVDETPTTSGNVVLEPDGTARVLRRGDDRPALTYTSHFATCPQAEQHRKR